MKVILLDYVYKHGVAGEVIDVADGFARNYLIPKGLAAKASPGELKRATKLRDQAATKRAALENRMNELARIIDNVELIFSRRAAITGKLFGSVTTQEIADALMEKSGVDINRRRISQQPLREVGTHDVPVRLGTEISPILKITIVRDEDYQQFLAERAAAEAGEAVAEAEGEGASDDAAEAVEYVEQTEVIPTAAVAAALAEAQAEAASEAIAEAEEAPAEVETGAAEAEGESDDANETVG
jgi:large subunit ribosomal protein L9